MQSLQRKLVDFPSRPPPVVTKGDVEAERQRLKTLEAQPIKKIAEAKARKKKRLQVGLLNTNLSPPWCTLYSER